MIILIIDAHIIISPSYQYYRDYNIKNGPRFVRRRGRQGCCGLFIFFLFSVVWTPRRRSLPEQRLRASQTRARMRLPVINT